MKQNYSMVAIDPETHHKAKVYCAKKGLKIGGLVSALLEKHIKESAQTEGTEVKAGNGAI